MNAGQPPKLTGVFQGEQFHATVILLLAGVLALSWKFFGSQNFHAENLRQVLPLGGEPGFNAAVYRFATCLLGFGLLPAMVVRGVFGHRLCDYGVTFGLWRRVLIWIAISVPLFVTMSYFGADRPEYQAEYPVNPHAGESTSMFALHAMTYLAFYVGWEFFFRGFMLFGLEKPLGPTNAIIIQAIVSSMLHIGDPASEAFGGFFVGLIWGFAAFRTRSLLPSLVGHATLGISLDWFLCRLAQP